MSSATSEVPDSFAEDVQWLLDHPEFDERPPSISEFLGPGYLDIRRGIRRRIYKELVEIFGEEFVAGKIARYGEVLITGGVGIGKTTIASIVLSYMACCTLCLRDPQAYYGLLPGSRIAFMMMSTTRAQALAVIFSDTKARIDNSEWFRSRHPRDDNYKNQIAFDKHIYIIPGDSQETTFEGFNLLGGVMDEIDSHKTTATKDYAEAGYSTISSRITSRFGNQGLLVLIGQTKTEGGFAMRRYAEFQVRNDAYAVKMAIWESLDAEKFCGQKFYYDRLRSKVVLAPEAVVLGLSANENVIEIPIEYLQNFKIDPDKALRDLAGIPRKVSDPFIRNTDKILLARSRYDVERAWVPRPWHDGRIARELVCDDGLVRYGHIDIGYSADGDAAGVAIGHIAEYVDTDEGMKPFIIIDCIARLRPPPGRQLEIAEIRQVVYDLLARGYRIRKITIDGFQSTDSMQMLRKRRIHTDLLSVDKKLLPYSDLRDAIYEERIAIPPVMDLLRRADTKEVDVIVKELSELGYTPNGDKVDHPAGGSKDCADALAGTVHNLMARARAGGRTSAPASYGRTTTAAAAGAGTTYAPLAAGMFGTEIPRLGDMPRLG